MMDTGEGGKEVAYLKSQLVKESLVWTKLTVRYHCLSFPSNCGRPQADILIEGFVSWHKDTSKCGAFLDLDNSTRKIVLSHFRACLGTNLYENATTGICALIVCSASLYHSQPWQSVFWAKFMHYVYT